MGLFQKLFGAKPKNKKDKKNKAESAVEVAKNEEAVEAVAVEEPKPVVKAEATAKEVKVEKCEATVEAAPVVETTPKEEKVAEEPKAAPAPKKRTPAKKPAPVENKEVKEEAPKTEVVAEEEPAVAKTPKTGRFEIKKAKDGRFVFNLYASNHVIVATSQIYSSSTSAINGINSIINNAERANVEDQTLKTYETVPFPKWEIYEDKGGQFRFRLSAPNGSCIVHSQGYTSKASCKNGIDSIIKSVKNAEIDKAYLKKD